MSLTHRPRRLRGSDAIRRMTSETRLSVDDFIMPLFVTQGTRIEKPIPSMPSICHQSIDKILETCAKIVELNIPAILLFGTTKHKDETGSYAWQEDSLIPEAIKSIKKAFPALVIITDICLCTYTASGHCGIIKDDKILNDETLEYLSKIAVSHAKAGADFVAPSDMMDGRIAAIRTALDTENLTDTGILSYSAKYASAFYGPFRDAADSTPSFGDRKTYQMNPANIKEAVRETLLDIEEGADMVMVKPALAYMDVIREISQNIDIPVVAYNVSGEFSMVKAATEKGWVDEKSIVLESLTGMKRAGANIIITYHAIDAARWLNEQK
ncbi:MAG: porphobilinogen synthase [Alphaproteobacteria bacterium]